MNVKKLKSAIGIVVTWALSFMLMAVQCIFLPFFRGTEYQVWGILLVIPWLYAIQYLYYKLIKRYTKWWDVWKEK